MFSKAADRDAGVGTVNIGACVRPSIRMTRASALLRLIPLLAFGATSIAHAACHVTAAADANGSGASWASPMRLQAALGASACTEVWVAKGAYLPSPGSYEVSFVVRPGVQVYGGFAGTEASRDDRNIAANPTVLSGDVFNDDIKTDGVVMRAQDLRNFNSRHVVYMGGPGAPVESDTVLDGFTITGGNAQPYGGQFRVDGGGLLCDAANGGVCSPTLRNLVFIGNGAFGYGAGMYVGGAAGRADPVISNVSFVANSAFRGGALYIDGGYGGSASPTITDARFVGNVATVHGGAVAIDAQSGMSAPNFDRVLFENNRATEGGGMWSFGNGRPIVRNSAFLRNLVQNSDSRQAKGGAVFIAPDGYGNATATFGNVTFEGNLAARGGAAYVSGTTNAGNFGHATATFDNATFTRNSSGQGMVAYARDASGRADVMIRNSIVWYSATLTNVVSEASLLDGDRISFDHGVFETQCARCTSTTRLDPRLGKLRDNGGGIVTRALEPGSSAIDAGDNAICAGTTVGGTDARGLPRAPGARCDAGAFEYQTLFANDYEDMVDSCGPPGYERAQTEPTLAEQWRSDGGAFAPGNYYTPHFLAGTYMSLQFDRRMFPVADNILELRGDLPPSSIGPRTGKFPFVSVSTCPGGFVAPLAVASPGCARPVVNGTTLLLNFGPALADPKYCNLSPEVPYYLNFVFDDPADGWQPAAACDGLSAERCSFRLIF